MHPKQYNERYNIFCMHDNIILLKTCVQVFDYMHPAGIRFLQRNKQKYSSFLLTIFLFSKKQN